jgi:SAM-dependent methyltransferase
MRPGGAADRSRVGARRSVVRILAGLLWEMLAAGLALAGVLALAYFPYDTDGPLSEEEMRKTREFYAQAYAAPPGNEPDSPNTERYVKIAAAVAEDLKVEDRVREFAERYDLAGKRVLEVGAGRGYLQDIVGDYTGLDISSSARRFFHKPFVLGSATAMPFEDDAFDAVWTVWVLEHVPAPEQALAEIRRVVKPGGYVFLMPAWNVMPWVAGGYNVRPYSDFGLGGKLIKASIYPRMYLYVLAQNVIRPVRLGWAELAGGPTALRYRRLEPNYDTYWGPDSDAVNSLDRFETALWFTSRGDRWLNREDGLVEFGGPLILQVDKPAAARNAASAAGRPESR